MAAELSGRLVDVKIREVLQWVRHSRRTGSLLLSADDCRASVEFHQGNIVRAATSEGYTDLGTILVDGGALSTDELKKATRLQKRRKVSMPLGRLLIEKKMISGEQLNHAMRQQIDQVIEGLLTLGEGRFEFQATEVALDTLTQKTSDVVLEADVRRKRQI